MKIHIDWSSGVSLDEAYTLKSSIDYGIYQIYGSHPVYGHNVLLYIGKAQDQTFGVRLNQHIKWIRNQDSTNVRVYTGRISSDDFQDSDWDLKIDLAERLLIYTHQPACNSSNLNSLGEMPEDTHVYNWVDRGMLLPEVSAYRYLVADAEFENFDLLSTE
ncbi:hypothetical protein GLP22_07335 [Photobacterium carnosum]|uniref:hypothetical protein n=1 Tax=Photobacterium carnosum TaxID=2023717 RepID=UPI00128C4459|nr:hypothetical protein [Photobacterium carnosum]KAE8177295.1 hypothetical protein CIT27_08320 [Photobacterium carnosum]MCD9541019.1 hypothetical protein [Photobacterium carnosum]